jgi:hypothetical protein
MSKRRMTVGAGSVSGMLIEGIVVYISEFPMLVDCLIDSEEVRYRFRIEAGVVYPSIALPTG